MLLAQAEADIGGNAHVRKQRIRLEHGIHRPSVRRKRGDVSSVQQNVALIRSGESGDGPQQCRLTRAGCTEEYEEFTPTDGQIEIAQSDA